MQDRVEKALKYFSSGFNCAQSVIIAFEDMIPQVDRNTLLNIAAPLGGGIARTRKTCGAVIAAVITISLIDGEASDSNSNRERIYPISQNLIKDFESKFNATECKDLLANLKNITSDPIPSIRDGAYYKVRPCAHFVVYAVKLVCDYISLNTK